MSGWECNGCWRGYCRVISVARRALNRFVIEGHLSGWFLSIPRIYLFESHVHCFLLLLLLFAFGSSNGESTEGSSQTLQGIVPQPT